MKKYIWIMLAAMLPMVACNKSAEGEDEDKDNTASKVNLSEDYNEPLKTFGDSLGHYLGLDNGMGYNNYIENLSEDQKAKMSDSKAFLEGLRSVISADLDNQSYAMGQQMGMQIYQTMLQMNEAGIDVNVKALYASLAKTIVNEKISTEAMDSVMTITNQLYMQAQQKMQEAMMKKQEAELTKSNAETAKNIEAGQKFLDKLRSDKSIVFSPSGLAYKVKKQGAGKVAGVSDEVDVKYTGRLIDGTEFDSSKGQYAHFPVNNVIPGFGEALTTLPSGTVATLYIPAEIGYGNRAMASIPAGSLLIFDIEIK